MSDDKIAEIRARHEAGPIGHLPIAAFSLADDDRATLLAEVGRLRAENHHHRITTMNSVSKSLHEAAIAEKDAEIERLQELLRGVSRDVAENQHQSPALPYQTVAGCMCPPGANLYCQNSFCPRRALLGVIVRSGT